MLGLFLEDVLEVLLLQGREVTQPARRGDVAGGGVGHQLVELVVIADRVAGVFGGLGVAHHRGPEGLFFRGGVAVNLADELLEQGLAGGILGLGRLDHGQEGAVAVVILDQASEDRRVAAKLRGRR